VTDDLQWVRSGYNSVRGRIESNWRREDGRLYFAVKIPANTEAMVYLPVAEGESVMESGNDARSAEGIRFVKKDNGVQIYQAGSGQYSFVISK
jgi:alpha-L-rhamnosidase